MLANRESTMACRFDADLAGIEIYELQSLSRVVSTSILAPDWLHKSEQPKRSQAIVLIQLLTIPHIHKFPLQGKRWFDGTIINQDYDK